ncbi:hypothetical protein V6N12_069705 [Hibiscus sabdariffa]|uniref:Uncharacterized protein n=1 Tax=Hibiscus sabdariffa TaxID=183260 RepID=A0ABR2FEP4_9ROSI
MGESGRGLEAQGEDRKMIVNPKNQKRNKADSNQRYRSFDSSAEDRRKGLLWNGSAEDRRKGSIRNGRIEESVEIEVGNVVHEVSIVEMGFKDTSIDKVSWANKLEQQIGKVESKSEGSSEQVRCFQGVEDEQSFDWEKDVINDVFIGKDFEVNRGQELGITERHIGEFELMGEGNSLETLKSGEVFVEGNSSGEKLQETDKLRDVGARGKELEPCVAIKKSQQVASDRPPFKDAEDLHNMGLTQVALEKDIAYKVARVEGTTTMGQAQVVLAGRLQKGAVEEEENRASFFPEMDFLKQRGKPKAKKKYSSLFELQDRALSSVERRKRDRSLSREKKKSNLDHSKLLGRSLSNSDLQTRWKCAKSEAKKSLELGKKLGMKIQGSEEVVRELTMLELN